MRTRRRTVAVVLAGALAAAALAAAPAALATAATPAPGIGNFGLGGFGYGNTHRPSPANGTSVQVCPSTVAPGQATCLAQRRTDSAATTAAPAPAGSFSPAVSSSSTLGNNGAYDPSYLQSAYEAPSSTNGTGQTVAIVDAYDDPNAASDLAAYRTNFGLPPCTTANGCFRKVSETGGTKYPKGNTGWGQEISLDLDMVSAICPNCDILLVEANSNSDSDLGASVNEAVSLGATEVSNSYGGPEYSGEQTTSAEDYNHPGIAVTVAAGDQGYGAEFPASSNTVTAVGGTTLEQATNTGTRDATETVWDDTGSGCSAYESKPAWQTDTGCSKRTNNDVSAVADPNTGVWVYDSYGGGTWGIFGGTSVATPIIASMYALADNGHSTTAMNSLPYADPSALNNVTSGSNGSCSVAYLCNGEVGYNAPTGLGTPAGIGAFSTTPPPPPAPGPPSAPTNLTATAGNNVVNLSWTAPLGDGGSPISYYNVYSNLGLTTNPPTPYTLIGSSPTTSYSDGTALNGNTYTYVVTAVNGDGYESLMSTSASAKPSAATIPGAPTKLTATQSGSIRTPAVALSWSAPASNGGSAVESYQVYRGTASGKETLYTTVACTTSTCSYSDTGVRFNTTYYYEVAATNIIGTGPDSNQASARAG